MLHFELPSHRFVVDPGDVNLDNMFKKPYHGRGYALCLPCGQCTMIDEVKEYAIQLPSNLHENTLQGEA